MDTGRSLDWSGGVRDVRDSISSVRDGVCSTHACAQQYFVRRW